MAIVVADKNMKLQMQNLTKWLQQSEPKLVAVKAKVWFTPVLVLPQTESKTFTLHTTNFLERWGIKVEHCPASSCCSRHFS
jgi:hypothetical protein